MIKLKIFPFDKADEANAFMVENPPRSTDKQSGMIFHNGNICIIYDDGIDNPKDRDGKVRSELEGDRGKKLLVEHSLGMAQSALDKEFEELQKIVPEGYQIGMNDEEIRKLLAAGTEATHIPKEHVEKFKDSIGPNEGRIENLQNQILMDSHEVRRLTHSIDSWEKMLIK